jgi:hypothetical protein
MWLLAKFVLKGNNGNTFLESFILNFQNLPPIWKKKSIFQNTTIKCYMYKFNSRSGQGVLDTTLCDKVCHARYTWYNIMW